MEYFHEEDSYGLRCKGGLVNVGNPIAPLYALLGCLDGSLW